MDKQHELIHNSIHNLSIISYKALILQLSLKNSKKFLSIILSIIMNKIIKIVSLIFS